MRKLHSGMDAWRYIVNSGSHHKAIENYLPLILSAAGAIGVLPFAILRYIQGNWLAAIVDTAIVAGFLIFGTYAYRTRQVRVASIAIAVLCTGGVIATVYTIGAHQVYWAFPGLIAVFYLLRPREAIGGAVVMLVALLPALLPSGDTHQTITIIITILVTSVCLRIFSDHESSARAVADAGNQGPVDGHWQSSRPRREAHGCRAVIQTIRNALLPGIT
ncbi:MAG: hypothetical protein OEU59_00355 [Gammaproteobacteria bacterium]|nr:hypothetical protein [Gammaproteobacteria bacterium]